MLTKLLTLLLIFSFSSSVSGRLKESYDEIMVIVNKYCKPDQYFNPPIKLLSYEKLQYPRIGQCFSDNRTHWEIKMDMIFWDKSDDDAHFQLMAHEWTHCGLNKNHVDNRGNYMYYKINYLSKKEVTDQLITNLKEVCGEK